MSPVLTVSEAAEQLGLDPLSLRNPKAHRRLRAYRTDGDWLTTWDDVLRYARWAGIPMYVGYHAAHARVRRGRSHISTFACLHCGNPAQQWAYNHTDSDELWEDGLPYSLNRDCYIPLCRTCHKRFDAGFMRKAV